MISCSQHLAMLALNVAKTARRRQPRRREAIRRRHWLRTFGASQLIIKVTRRHNIMKTLHPDFPAAVVGIDLLDIKHRLASTNALCQVHGQHLGLGRSGRFNDRDPLYQRRITVSSPSSIPARCLALHSNRRHQKSMAPAKHGVAMHSGSPGRLPHCVIVNQGLGKHAPCRRVAQLRQWRAHQNIEGAPTGMTFVTLQVIRMATTHRRAARAMLTFRNTHGIHLLSHTCCRIRARQGRFELLSLLMRQRGQASQPTVNSPFVHDTYSIYI